MTYDLAWIKQSGLNGSCGGLHSTDLLVSLIHTSSKLCRGELNGRSQLPQHADRWLFGGRFNQGDERAVNFCSAGNILLGEPELTPSLFQSDSESLKKKCIAAGSHRPHYLLFVV